MRVLVCPDKFAGTLTAAQAAEAIAVGWIDAAPADHVLVRPLADGGPGFLDVLDAALGGERVPVRTTDPLGRPVTAQILLVGGTAYLESAQACGLYLLDDADRDPRLTTSYGVGTVLAAAAAHPELHTIVVGLGGSATNDGGAGLLAALGAAPVDGEGRPLPAGGAALAGCAALAAVPALPEVALVAAADVDNPLCGPAGATAVYGPQKGATAADVTVLDAALARFAAVLERDLPTCPPGLATLPGGGAAGGLGAALLALGARRLSGIELIRVLSGFDAAIGECDLVVTGEGSFDDQSLRGKVVASVAAAAADRGLPCLVLAGQVRVPVDLAAAAGVTGAFSVADHTGGVAAALADPAGGLRALAARVAASRRS